MQKTERDRRVGKRRGSLGRSVVANYAKGSTADAINVWHHQNILPTHNESMCSDLQSLTIQEFPNTQIHTHVVGFLFFSIQ